MTITQAICNSFKQEILQAIHNFTASTGDTFKISLYTSAASLDASTTAYTASNEASGTGYSAGGQTLTSQTPSLSSGVAMCNFNNVTWASSSITARGALIYNSSKANKAVAVLDFGADKTSSSGDFTIQFPALTSTTAIIRIT